MGQVSFSPSNHRKSGFTIVELLIVIVVIAILAAIAVAAYSRIQQRARDADRQSDMSILQKKLDMYYADNNSYPNTTQMRDTAFRKEKLGIENSDVFKPPIGSATINYCWPGSTTIYCYVGHKKLNGAAGDCAGIAAGESEVQCAGYQINYALEASPSTSIILRGGSAVL